MNAATEEKTTLEEAQRASSKERKAKCEEWSPAHFQQDLKSGHWAYKHADLRPWDPRNDVYQYECNYVISTRTRHLTPMIRTSSISSIQRQPEDIRSNVMPKVKRKINIKQGSFDGEDNDTGTESEEYHSDSTQSAKYHKLSPNNR